MTLDLDTLTMAFCAVLGVLFIGALVQDWLEHRRRDRLHQLRHKSTFRAFSEKAGRTTAPTDKRTKP